MVVLLTFLLGIANFAMHRAVMESGHPLIDRMPWFYHALNRRLSLVVEFIMLLAGMLLAAQGFAWGAVGYVLYSALNALSAWMILTGRV